MQKEINNKNYLLNKMININTKNEEYFNSYLDNYDMEIRYKDMIKK